MSSRTENQVPEWAKSVVWYQIFPERFRNGDSKNDPTLKDMKGAAPHDDTEPWQIHPWTSDWYELQPYEQANGRDLWFNILRRRYGGDLQGVLEKLDYLEELGVGALYLNPVFEAPSHHKYDGATYHHIDPNFGPDPDGDRKLMAQEIPDAPRTWVWTAADKLMLDLIAEVHARGMRIIFDGVFNHVGINHWAFRDVIRNQQQSRFKDWFDIRSWENGELDIPFRYRSWWAVPELPEWRQHETGLAAGPRDYIFAATRRWMDPDGDDDPADGIDGWRLDVAFCVPHPFWKEWRTWVKSINPEAYLTAEVIDGIDELQTYLAGDEFDAVMNYNFSFACEEYFIAESSQLSASEFDARLRKLREAFHPEVTLAMQNLFDSHDTSRIGSLIVNRDKYSYSNWMQQIKQTKASNPAYDTRKPTQAEIQIQKLMTIFQMTYVGAPMLYYGDEAGMWGANDPCCRKPMVWDDLTYDPERRLPNGTVRSEPDPVKFDRDLFDHYKKLIAIRNGAPALQNGDFATLLTDDHNQIYAFLRTHGSQKLVVVLNNAETKKNVRLRLPDGVVNDILNDKRIQTENDPEIEIESMWARIITN